MNAFCRRDVHDWIAPVSPLFLDLRWCSRCNATDQYRETYDGLSAEWVPVERERAKWSWRDLLRRCNCDE